MIVVCGEALIDLTAVDHNGKAAFVAQPGGSPLNVAIGLGRLGAKVAYLGKISTDPFGQVLINHMASSGVNTEFVTRSDHPTTLAFVHQLPDSETGYSFYNIGTADRNLLPVDLPTRLPNDANAVHFGSISLLNEPSASTIESLMVRERQNRLITFDPNVRPSVLSNRSAYLERVEHLVCMASIVKVSQADLLWLYPNLQVEDVVAPWLEMGPMLIVVTNGSDGAQGFTSNIQVRVEGRSAKVVDTVGAGDAFMSGMLCRMEELNLLQHSAIVNCDESTLTEVITFGNQYAAVTCSREGANPPHRSELDAEYE